MPWPLPPTMHVLQLLRGAFADDGAGGGVDDEDFVHRQPAAAVAALEQELRDDAAQRIGEHGADLRLLIRGEDVDHAVDRLARVVGVQRAEDEQPRLGGGERELDGFQVAHFADEHDVGILAQGGLQARRESSRRAPALRAG